MGLRSSSVSVRLYNRHKIRMITSVGTRVSTSEKLTSNMFEKRSTTVGADSGNQTTKPLRPSFGASKLIENSFTGSLNGI